MNKEIQKLIRLPEHEEKLFGNYIKEQRELYITAPTETAINAFNKNKVELKNLVQNNQLSSFIHLLRSHCYDEFLVEEALFNEIVLSKIGEKFDVPRIAIENISKNLYNLKTKDLSDFSSQLQVAFGSYIGHITPYVYQLFLSNTQSRRSRAGKTFEGIIYFLYDYLNYPYDSQKSVGKAKFANLGLGKVVDSILPSVQSFTERRNKTIVGSMKTTLRERWQEVVEELQRSNLPNIHLLTVNDNISTNKIAQMAEHNIVLVVLQSVKEQPHLKTQRSVISFEEYFLKEIPTYLDYWKNNV